MSFSISYRRTTDLVCLFVPIADSIVNLNTRHASLHPLCCVPQLFVCFDTQYRISKYLPFLLDSERTEKLRINCIFICTLHFVHIFRKLFMNNNGNAVYFFLVKKPHISFLHHLYHFHTSVHLSI